VYTQLLAIIMRREQIILLVITFLLQNNIICFGQEHTTIKVFKDSISQNYGYCDLKNNVIIEPKFNFAYDFYDKVAVVELENEYGVINIHGKYVIEPKYKFISHFCHKHFIVENDSFALITVVDSIVYSFDYIPFSNDFIKSMIYDVEFDNEDIVKRIISISRPIDAPYTLKDKKKQYKTIIFSCSLSKYLSCLIIEYIIKNKEKIEKDKQEEIEFDKKIEELRKKGKIRGKEIILDIDD